MAELAIIGYALPQLSTEKTFAVGILLAFVGLGALAFPNLSGFLRIAAGTCLVFGVLLYKGAFFARVWDRGLIGSLQKTARVAVAANCGCDPLDWHPPPSLALGV